MAACTSVAPPLILVAMDFCWGKTPIACGAPSPKMGIGAAASDGVANAWALTRGCWAVIGMASWAGVTPGVGVEVRAAADVAAGDTTAAALGSRISCCLCISMLSGGGKREKQKKANVGHLDLVIMQATFYYRIWENTNLHSALATCYYDNLGTASSLKFCVICIPENRIDSI